MGTSWKEIYCRTNITDTKMNILPTNLKYKLLSNLMKQSTGFFETDCNKDISTFNDFYHVEYDYISDGIQTEIQIEPIPQDLVSIYIGYRKNSDFQFVEIKSYIYDELLGVITLDSVIPEGYEIYVAFYEIGSFNVDLNQTEINILSCGIEVCWNDAQRQKDTLLNQRVYSSSSKAYSQANHLKVLNELHDSMYFKKLQSMINSYTFKQATDNLVGLSGEKITPTLGWW